VFGCSGDGHRSTVGPDSDVIVGHPTQNSKQILNLAATHAESSIPTEGTVIEGVSVPGVALGDTRLDVYASWGLPYSRTSYHVTGYSKYQFGSPFIGWAWVTFKAPEGSEQTENPDDIVTNVQWGEGFPDWVTTEGINTYIAEYEIEAVLAAYPDADVTYYQYSWYPDYVFSVTDYMRGIRVERPWNIYGGNASIFMSIFEPGPPPDPPDPPDRIRVTDVTLTGYKVKGKENIVGTIQLETSTGDSAEGATISAYWSLPNGSKVQKQGTADSNGQITFTLTNVTKKGTHYLFVTDVVLEGFMYDKYNSDTYGSLTGDKKK
jgi:hypothetical protein